MKNQTEYKTLSKKRFIPMILIMLLGIILLSVTGKNYIHFLRYTILIFDFPNRTAIIWFIASIIGLFHFIYITRKNQDSKNILFNTSLGIVDSMFSAWGYALVSDKAMNLGSGLLKDLFGEKPFFTDSSQVDYWSLGLIVLIIIVIGIWKIYKMGSETVFEISHNVKSPTGEHKK